MNRALIVIDVQNEYETGVLPIVHPPLAVSLPNIGVAMDAARAAGIPVVVVVQQAPEGAPTFAAGSAGDELHPVVAGRPRDHVVAKAFPGAFTGTDLGPWLRERDIAVVTLVGFMTQNCVDATAKQAFDAGLRVEILDDATGTLPYANSAGAVDAEQLHRTILIALNARFAAVAGTADWVRAVEAGELLVGSTVFESAAAGRGDSPAGAPPARGVQYR